MHAISLYMYSSNTKEILDFLIKVLLFHNQFYFLLLYALSFLMRKRFKISKQVQTRTAYSTQNSVENDCHDHFHNPAQLYHLNVNRSVPII